MPQMPAKSSPLVQNTPLFSLILLKHNVFGSEAEIKKLFCQIPPLFSI